MSGTALKEKVEKRSKIAIWFNDLFRTKLEIDAEKLEKMMQAGNQNTAPGNYAFVHSRPNLQKEVLAKLSTQPKFIVVSELTATFWCDLPKVLWEKFEQDSVFLQRLHDELNALGLTDKLVAEWAKRLQTWERVAAEADAKGDKAGVTKAQAEFTKDCETLSRECEQVAGEAISKMFREKAETFGDYKRYKFKAGAKLTFTIVGVIASVAALSTAATPAAPATLVPAIIGLVSASMSIGTQIANLSASAEEIEAEINDHLQNLEVSYKDKAGKPKKKTYKAREFGAGFLSGMTGGFSDVFIPSIKGLLDETGLHKSKLDGLDVGLHQMGNNINAMVDGLGLAEKVLQDNLDFLTAKVKAGAKSDKINKAMKAYNAALHDFQKARVEFEKAFKGVPAMINQIEDGRAHNKEFKEKLEAVQKALGTANYALAANILATLTLIGIGFSGGLPAEHVEKITSYTALAWSGLDALREYTPEFVEKIAEA